MEDHVDLYIKHAALIFIQEHGISVENARFRAWCEGPEGYAERLKKEAEIKENDDDI